MFKVDNKDTRKTLQLDFKNKKTYVLFNKESYAKNDNNNINNNNDSNCLFETCIAEAVCSITEAEKFSINI